MKETGLISKKNWEAEGFVVMFFSWGKILCHRLCCIMLRSLSVFFVIFEHRKKVLELFRLISIICFHDLYDSFGSIPFSTIRFDPLHAIPSSPRVDILGRILLLFYSH